jgi:hypothetical protein
MKIWKNGYLDLVNFKYQGRPLALLRFKLFLREKLHFRISSRLIDHSLHKLTAAEYPLIEKIVQTLPTQRFDLGPPAL